MRLLLVNPRFPESFWSFKWALGTMLPGKKTINPPLGLATLAALCPDGWEVTIVDENIETVPLHPEVDIVGVCGMGVQFPRQHELLAYYRGLGYYTVAGGSFTSLCPERYDGLADTVVAGEAEYIWPEFCRDYSAGAAHALYQETGVVSLEDSPVPRFDLLKLEKYRAVSLQFSRGCPFRCEFCDIIVMFGRKPRAKSLEQVGRELDALRALGAHRAFFVDDNLIGDKRAAKGLLRFLADYQRRHDYELRFGTEASLNLAQDQELLELFRAANFEWVFVGIESPDEQSLKETLKFQNTREDLLTSVRAIYSHGLDVFAGFIIGFDHDTVETFERQYQFIVRSGIQAAMIGLLQATPKTPLYERLAKAGRLIGDADSTDNVKLSSNVMPVGMSYEEMVTGYRKLHDRLFDDPGIAARVKNKFRHLRTPVADGRYGPGVSASLAYRFLVHALLPGGPRRWWWFVRSLPWGQPWLIPRAMEDWVVGLAMRDYIDRHFQTVHEPARALGTSYVRRIERALARYRESGALEISADMRQAAVSLSLHLRGWLDRRFYARAARHLERLLRETRSSVTLHVDHLHQAQVRHLQRLLRRLSRYGDRIRITLNERVSGLVHIDSSVFQLSFEAHEIEAR